MKIKENLTSLKEMDVWSIVLFALFRIREIPEYSALSELAYILDEDSMLKLCEYFGGLTITIPTIDQLENMIRAFVLYQLVNIDKMDYEDAIKVIGADSYELREIKATYTRVCEILNDYSFTGR